LAPRRGRKRAIIAVGHRIRGIAFHLLTRQEDDADRGPNYFDERNRRATERRLIDRLARMGLKVTVERIDQAA
jgi:transposase